MREFAKETDELVPLKVELVGQIYNIGLKVQVLKINARPDPAGWVDAIMLNGQPHAHIAGLDFGIYQVWYQITSAPETPVGRVDDGKFRVS